MKKVLLVMTLSVLSSTSFATHFAASELQGDMNKILNNTDNLLEQLVPGKILSRLHAQGDSENIKSKVERINTGLDRLKAKLEKNLLIERLEPSSFADNELIAQTSIVNEFNATVAKLKKQKIVFDEDNWFGSFGHGSRIIAQQIAPVNMTAFDYSRGFQVECESSWHSGLVAFRNTKTGVISWHSSWNSGLAVVGVNEDGSAVLQSDWYAGLSSDYDPHRQEWVVSKGGWKTPSAAVFNPTAGFVEKKISSWKMGLAGVYNPNTKTVEWKSDWQSGIAGYFDPHLNKVVWQSSWKSGVACIWRDSNGDYHSSSGFSSDFGDNDD